MVISMKKTLWGSLVIEYNPVVLLIFLLFQVGILPNESLKETVIWIYSKEAYTALYFTVVFTVVIFSSMKPVIWAFNSLSWGVGPESKRICQLEIAVRAEWSWMSKQDKYSSLFMSLFAYSYAAYIVNRDLEDWKIFVCVLLFHKHRKTKIFTQLNT